MHTSGVLALKALFFYGTRNILKKDLYPLRVVRMADAPDDSISTRDSLLQRLKDWRDQSGWQEFFNIYWRLIYSVARRSGLSDAEAQDVVQDTVISVAKSIQGFVYDPALGSFKGWLMRVIQRRIRDVFRKKHYQVGDQKFPKEEALDTQMMATHPDAASVDLDQTWEEEWQRNAIETALERIRGQANPRDFQIFDLHVKKGLEVREVAARVGVNSAQVYMAKYRISALLKKEIKSLEKNGF